MADMNSDREVASTLVFFDVETTGLTGPVPIFKISMLR